jgi:hypothetical protein
VRVNSSKTHWVDQVTGHDDVTDVPPSLPALDDLIITPDTRRWRVTRIIKSDRTNFVAEEEGTSAVFIADVRLLTWYFGVRCWKLVDRRTDRADPRPAGRRRDV